MAKRDNVPPLSKEAADQMLSNVFEACDFEPNRVPLEVLQSYSHYRRERHILQKCIIVLVAVLFLMLPILFITASVEVTWVEGTPPGSPIVQVAAKSIVPVESITASIGDYSLEVYQVSDGIYQIHPNANGTLMVTVTLANKQFTEHKMEVSGVDVEPPTLVSSQLVDGELEIFFQDDISSIDFSTIYAVDPAGQVVYPLRHDADAVSVTFAYPEDHLNIFVADTCGNTLQLVLTTQ